MSLAATPKEIVEKSNQLEVRDNILPETIEALQAISNQAELMVSFYEKRLSQIKTLPDSKQLSDEILEIGQPYGILHIRAAEKTGGLLKNLDSKYSLGSPGRTKTLPEGITKKQSHLLQEIFRHPELANEAIDEAIEMNVIPTVGMILRKISKVQKNSGCNEWYTPDKFIKAATEVMDTIDLDPASTVQANKIVKAKKIYTMENDGLSQAWAGNVWLNPPYSSDLVEKFIYKLCESYETGKVSQAIVLVNNATETAWFQKLALYARAIAFPKGRIKYLNVKGVPQNTPIQGQVFVYVGGETQAKAFKNVFSLYGVVFSAF